VTQLASKKSFDYGLQSELDAARVVADRLLNKSKDNPDPVLLRTLLEAFDRIAVLARSHALVTGTYEPVESAILAALEELNNADISPDPQGETSII
jgi:hypothetical protein